MPGSVFSTVALKTDHMISGDVLFQTSGIMVQYTTELMPENYNSLSPQMEDTKVYNMVNIISGTFPSSG